MRKRAAIESVNISDKVLVDTVTLQGITSCGRVGATKIGMAAGARVKVGKRALWNVDKIRAYLEQISEGKEE